MRLTEIVWPVFRLGEKKPEFDNGLAYYHSEYVDEEIGKRVNVRVIDDKSLPMETIGLRRLHLIQAKTKMFPISTAIYFLADLLKLAKASTWFVDNSGQVFQYKKATRAKLTTKKIKQVLPAQGLGCVLEVEGIATRFKCLQRPKDYQQYAVLLQNGMSYMLYGLSEMPRANSWRMV